MKLKRLIFGVTIFLILSINQSNAQSNVRVVYNSDTSLVCNISGSSFIFYSKSKDNSTAIISTDETKYVVSNATLTIKSIKKTDIEKTYWCKADNATTLDFVFEVRPYLYQVDSLSMPVIEGYKAILNCYLLVGNQNGQNTTWIWTYKDFNTPFTNDSSSVVSNNTQSILTINSASILYRGSIFCTAINNYGNHSRNVTLLVKSKLAPLWPFIGLLLEVILLATILFFNYYYAKKKEEKQKSI